MAEAQTQVEIYAENARQWWRSGRRYYIVTLSLAETAGNWTGERSDRSPVDVTGTLQAIEDVGWQLYDIGYVYQPHREKSRVLTDSAWVYGDIVGIYTFTRPSAAPTMPTPPPT